MDDPNTLKAENVKVTEKQVIQAGGGQQSHTVVSYMIGSHGPFTLSYPTGQFDPQKAKADIAQQVQKIKQVISQ
jgi:hypothetical protein